MAYIPGARADEVRRLRVPAVAIEAAAIHATVHSGKTDNQGFGIVNQRAANPKPVDLRPS